MKKEELLSGLVAMLANCTKYPAETVSPPSVTTVEQRSFLYRGIKIQGPEGYASTMIHALDLIYDNDPQNWLAVEKNITVIRFNPPSGIQVTTGVFDTDINETTSQYYQPLSWVAGEIVHDAWHREYYRRGEMYSSWEGEKKCMERQNEFFTKVEYPLLNIEEQLQTRFWEIEPRTW